MASHPPPTFWFRERCDVGARTDLAVGTGPPFHVFRLPVETGFNRWYTLHNTPRVFGVVIGADWRVGPFSCGNHPAIRPSISRNVARRRSASASSCTASAILLRRSMPRNRNERSSHSDASRLFLVVSVSGGR